jgi:predicted ester cyclase
LKETLKARLLFQAALSAALLCGCAASREHALQQNKELVRHYFQGWANRGDPAVADALIATNVVLRNPPAVIHSLTEYKQGMTAFHSAFPDLQFTIEDEIAEGNKIAVRWTLRATHLGEYQGHPPPAKRWR